MEQKRSTAGQKKIAELKLVYRSRVKAADRPVVMDSAGAWEFFRASWDMERIELVEQVKMLLLNQANKVLGLMELSTGGGAGAILDVRLVFAAALKANASRLILCHNHPSGNLKASLQDRQITGRMKSAGRLLDIEVLDHLIIVRDGYFSFADEGLL